MTEQNPDQARAIRREAQRIRAEAMRHHKAEAKARHLMYVSPITGFARAMMARHIEGLGLSIYD